jgi:hypothetical protein
MDVQLIIEADVVEREGQQVSVAVCYATLEDDAAVEGRTDRIDAADQTQLLEDVVELDETVQTD